MDDDLKAQHFRNVACALGRSIGIPFCASVGDQAEEVTFISLHFDEETVDRAFSVRDRNPGNNGSGNRLIELVLDETTFWQAVVLTDDRGREWRSYDRARSFRHGDLVFRWSVEAA